MRNLLRISALLIVAAASVLPQSLYAQSKRADKTAFLRPQVGIAYYLGDNEKSPFNFDGDLFDNDFSYSAALEVGYQFNPRYSLGLGIRSASYGGITEFVNGMDVSSHPTTRTSVELTARYLLSEGRIAPYVQGGLHTTFGKTALFSPGAPCLTTGVCATSNETSFGPLLGFGLDFLISDNTSFFIEHGVNLTFGDARADGYDGNGFGGFDYLGHTSLGLKLNLKRFTPVVVDNIVCPVETIETGTPIMFTGSVNPDATLPVAGSWDFGDGGTGSGLSASHSFSSAGSFDVAFTATNGMGKGRDVRTCPVTVKPACEAAEIVSMSASQMNPDTETSVRFSSSVSGSSPVTYSWDFGDGSSSTEANPSHTFKTAGSYTVTLSVTNCGGTVTRTITVDVDPYEAAICREITEMNSALFARNSSTLSAEARATLQENLEILLECPNLNVRVEGWATPGERRAQQLSEDRAHAAEQFYMDNGVAASRMVTAGMGRARGTSKKEGMSGYRRVDTIPVR
jgi:PKD repeat protein/outer membrane protein W